MSLGSIQFLSGPLVGSTFSINKTVIKIGREPGNDIVISDPTVSRFHALLHYSRSQWIIEKLSPRNSLIVNSRDVHTAIINDHDTIGVGPITSFLFISIPTAPYQPTYQQQPCSPYPPYLQPPYPPPSPQRKTSMGVVWIILIVLGILIACSALNPLLMGVTLGALTILAIPVLLIWALVMICSGDNRSKPYAIPYQGISQGIIQQEQHVAYDSYNAEDSYNTNGQYIEHQNIYIHCENFIYYGQSPRGMISGPNMVVDEDEDDEEDEEEWEY